MKKDAEELSASSADHILEDNTNSWILYNSKISGSEGSSLVIENETLLFENTRVTFEKAMEDLKYLKISSTESSVHEISWNESEDALSKLDQEDTLLNGLQHKKQQIPVEASILNKSIEGKQPVLLNSFGEWRESKNYSFTDTSFDLSNGHCSSKYSNYFEERIQKMPEVPINFTCTDNTLRNAGCDETSFDKVNCNNCFENDISDISGSTDETIKQSERTSMPNSVLQDENKNCNIGLNNPTKASVLLADLSSDSMDSVGSKQFQVVDKICAIPINTSQNDITKSESSDKWLNFDDYFDFSVFGSKDDDQLPKEVNSSHCSNKPKEGNVETSDLGKSNHNLDTVQKRHGSQGYTNDSSIHQISHNDKDQTLDCEDQEEVLRRTSLCRLSCSTAHFQILVDIGSVCMEENGSSSSLLETRAQTSENNKCTKDNCSSVNTPSPTLFDQHKTSQLDLKTTKSSERANGEEFNQKAFSRINEAVNKPPDKLSPTAHINENDEILQEFLEDDINHGTPFLMNNVVNEKKSSINETRGAEKENEKHQSSYFEKATLNNCAYACGNKAVHLSNAGVPDLCTILDMTYMNNSEKENNTQVENSCGENSASRQVDDNKKKKQRSIYSLMYSKKCTTINLSKFPPDARITKWDQQFGVTLNNLNFKKGSKLNENVSPLKTKEENTFNEESVDLSESIGSGKKKNVPTMKRKKNKRNKIYVGPLRRSERLQKRREAAQTVDMNVTSSSAITSANRKKTNSKTSKTKLKRLSSSKKNNIVPETFVLPPALKKFIISKLKKVYKTESSLECEKICNLLVNVINSTDDTVTQNPLTSLPAKLYESGVCKTILDYYIFILKYTPLCFQTKVLPLDGYFSCSGPKINNTISEPLTRLYIENKKRKNKKKL